MCAIPCASLMCARKRQPLFCVHVRAAQDEVFWVLASPSWRGQSQALAFDCLSRLTGLTDRGLGEDAGGEGLVVVILYSRCYSSISS